MERTLETLRKKSDKTKEDLQRKVVENAMLIQEINDLRRDKKHLTLKLQELESRMAYQNQKANRRAESRGTQGGASSTGGAPTSGRAPPTRQSDVSSGSAVSNYRSAGRAT